MQGFPEFKLHVVKSTYGTLGREQIFKTDFFSAQDPPHIVELEIFRWCGFRYQKLVAGVWVVPNPASKRGPSAFAVYTAVHSILIFPYILDRGSCWRGSLRAVSNYTKYRTNVSGDRGQVDHNENPVTLQYRSVLGVIIYSILGIPEVSLSQAGDSL